MNLRIGMDNIHGGSDSGDLETFCSIVQQAGHEVTNLGVGPSKTQNDALSNSSDVMVQVAGGMCCGSLADFEEGCSTGYYHASQWCIPMYTKGWTQYDPKTYVLDGPAWDDAFSSEALRAPYIGKTWSEACGVAEHCVGFCEGDTIESLAQNFLSALNGGGGSGASGVVEGQLWSYEGEGPQHWNVNTYTDHVEIPFINFEMQDEYPRIRTASFETTENIDLTEGRVAVLIAGDSCNDFGGIIIKKDYDSKNKIYKYQCQGFMERIMSSPVYVVANGGHTAHWLIKKYLADIGLPDINLGEEDDYDVFVDEATQAMMKADADTPDSVENFQNDREIAEIKKQKAKEAKSSEGSSSSSSGSDSGGDISNMTHEEIREKKTGSGSEGTDGEGTGEEGEEEEEEDYSVINTFKEKPIGLYDKFTGGDFIRTIIFDYGINVDFYGDVNGIPHFDVMDMETWKNTGWIISPEKGYGEDYSYTFDITDVVTQVGVKNISAINGNGELYTSKELLGVNLEKYVGRMGTIVDNPNESSGATANNGEEVQYEDDEGNIYSADQVITTNGEPSCGNCTSANGGSKPEQKKYTKYWVNKCPGCEQEKTLESKSEGQGKTVCKECNLEFCQFCGHSLSGSQQLINVHPVTGGTSSTTTEDEDVEENN